MTTKALPLYTAGTPGADTNTYSLFDSTSAFKKQTSRYVFEFYRLHLKNSHSGTLKLSISSDSGANWTQVEQLSVSAASATGVNKFLYHIGAYRDLKVEWTNGGSAQTTWSVNQELTDHVEATSLTASLNDNEVPRADGSDGALQSSGVYVDDSGRLGVGTSAPTHSVTLPSTSTGAALYSTSDQTTNYARMVWSQTGGNFALQEEKGGSGSAGNVTIGAGTTGGNATFSALGVSLVLNAGSTAGTATLAGSVTTGTGSVVSLQNSTTMTSTSAAQSIVSVTGTVNQTSGTGGVDALKINPTLTAVGSGGARLIRAQTGGTDRFTVDSNGTVSACAGSAVPAGGTAGLGVKVSSTANLGVFFGSGAPTLSAAQGSLYLRTDGSSTSTRMYVNTDGSTGWTAVTTAT